MNKIIKIAMTSAYFATMKGGGEHYTYNLSNELANLGYDITIICGKQPLKNPEPLSNRFKIEYVPQLYFLRDWGIKGIRGASIVHYQQYLFYCSRYLEKNIHKYSLIITHDPISLRAAIKAKKQKDVPLVSIFHGPLSERLANNIDMNSVNAFISGGSSVPEENFLKHGAKRVFTVYSGINTEIFKPSNKEKTELRKRLNLPIDKKILINVGRLVPSKNIDSLLEASQILGQELDVHLLIIGDGALINKLKKLASKLAISITFLGAIPYKDLPPYYNASDVFVIPNSIGSFPLVALEAIACGCPVVTSIYSEDVLREFPNVIGIKNPTDPLAIAEAVKLVFQNGALAREMRESGLRDIHKHAWKHRAKQVDEIIKDLLAVKE